MKITVTAKVSAGYSQVIGAEIIQGEKYDIDETQFSDDLYERPAGFTPPWETVGAELPVKTKKGGTE